MTKADIVTKIAQKTGLEKADVSASLEAFFKVVKSSMAEGNNIYIRGFGTFVIKKRAAKQGRIISKNKTIIIDEHYVPSFKPAKAFIDNVRDSYKVKN